MYTLKMHFLLQVTKKPGLEPKDISSLFKKSETTVASLNRWVIYQVFIT